MLTDVYKSRLKSALAALASFRLIAILVVMSNLLLAYKVMTADTTEKTIVVPTSLQQPFFVRGSEVSPAYYVEMTKYFAYLLFQQHPDTVHGNVDEFLKYVKPTAYSMLRAKFMAEADRVKRNLISSSIYPKSIDVNKNIAVLECEIASMIGQQVVSRDVKFFEFKYDYSGGTLQISSLNEVKKRGDDTGYEVVADSNDDDFSAGNYSTQTEQVGGQ